MPSDTTNAYCNTLPLHSIITPFTSHCNNIIGASPGPSPGTTAEDELNARDKAISQRNAEVNAARLAHMKGTYHALSAERYYQPTLSTHTNDTISID